jgi:hypothetical protein
MAAVGDDLNFIDEHERELYAAAVLGEQARMFLKTHPIGQYLHHRAKLVMEQARIDALNVNPDGFGGWFRARRKLRAIRLQAETAKMFVGWMADAITDGDRAGRELDEYRNT